MAADHVSGQVQVGRSVSVPIEFVPDELKCFKTRKLFVILSVGKDENPP